MNLKTDSVTSGFDQVKRQSKAAMAEVRKEVNESNHSLGLFGEAFGVTVPRHIRTFVSQMPGVASAMSVAFDGIAVIVVIKVLVEAAEKVKKLTEAYEEAGRASQKMADGTKEITDKLEVSGRALIVHTDHLQKMIDKLEHKPHNGLKDALDEAAEHADILFAKLKASFDEAAKLLKENEVGFLGQMVGKSSNADVTKISTDTKKQIDALPRDENFDVAANVIVQKAWRQLEAMRITSNRAGDRDIQKHGQNRGLIDSINTEQNVLSAINDYGDKEQTDDRKQKEADVAQAKNDKDKDADAKRRKALEEQKQADAKEKTAIEERLKTLATGREKLEMLLNTPVRAGNQNWLTGERGSLINEGQKQFAKDYKPTNAWETAISGTSVRLGNMSAPLQGGMQALPSGHALTEALKKASEEAGQSSKLDLEDVTRKSQIAQSSIDWREKTGQLSQYAAAMQLTALHTGEYANKLNILKAAQDALVNGRTTHSDGLTDAEYSNKLKANKNEQSELTGGYNLQHAEDLWKQQMQTAGAGMRDFWESVITDSENAAQAVKSAMTQTMAGINSDLAKAMTGQKTNWSKTFEGVGTSTLTSGLKMGEGQFAKALGLGAKRGDSAGTPMFVQEVANLAGGAKGAIGGALGKAGGWLSGLFHRGGGVASPTGIAGADTSGAGVDLSGGIGALAGMIPGLAAGGDGDGLTLVGENGPEVANLPSGSHVTNHSDLTKMLKGGGGVTNHYTIDARGTNAAEVDMRVKQGMLLAHNQAVSSTMKAQQERARRRPSGSRG
jgi:hypothetical protein